VEDGEGTLIPIPVSWAGLFELWRSIFSIVNLDQFILSVRLCRVQSSTEVIDDLVVVVYPDNAFLFSRYWKEELVAVEAEERLPFC